MRGERRMPHSGHRATLLPCPGHRGQKAQLPDPVPVSAQLSALPQPLVEPGDRGPGGSQILPPLVPPASSAALLGSAAAGPARAALAVVPVQLLVVLTANDPCGQHTDSQAQAGPRGGLPVYHSVDPRSRHRRLSGVTVAPSLYAPHPRSSRNWAGRGAWASWPCRPMRDPHTAGAQ